MKKKILILIAVVSIAAMLFAFCACTDTGNEGKDDTKINVVIPDGAPALAIAKLLSSSNFDGYQISYEIVAGATDIAGKVASCAADIAIMPTNLAAIAYTKNSVDIKLVATNVFGLIYLLGTENITSIDQLRGEKILCTGQAGTPDFVLQYVLAQNGVSGEDLNIEYISQGSDAIAALKQGTAKFALLGEPAATMAVKNANASVVIDLQEEWQKLTGYEGYPQAGTVVKSSVLTNHATFVKDFLKAMRENVSWIAEEDNVSLINQTLKSHNSTSSFASVDVIERCNIRYEDAITSKNAILHYFTVMQSFKPAFVGGELPNDEFFTSIALD